MLRILAMGGICKKNNKGSGVIGISTFIELDPVGRAHCTISIQRYHSKIKTPISFKVDTGADFTTISKNALYSLGYDRNWIDRNKKSLESRIFTIASGEEISTYFIQLPSIDLYGYRAINWPFAIISGEGMAYRQLLGLNLLTYFNLTVDYDKGFYNVSHVTGKPRNEMLFNNQEIFKAE